MQVGAAADRAFHKAHGEDVMRILVIGAGALGGYFGACLARAGRDVTFLVRQRRAEQLARDGLRVVSPHGDFTVPGTTVLAGDLREPFDLVLVGVKSYSLDEALDQFAPAVGPETAILPILNGMAHLDTLSARFGAERVLGGTALITATLDADGRVTLMAPIHDLIFGEIAGGFSERTRALSALLGVSGFNAKPSDMVLQDMWEKWASLGTGAGMCCLMRASIGDIVAAEGGARCDTAPARRMLGCCYCCGFPAQAGFYRIRYSLFHQGGVTK